MYSTLLSLPLGPRLSLFLGTASRGQRLKLLFLSLLVQLLTRLGRFCLSLRGSQVNLPVLFFCFFGWQAAKPKGEVFRQPIEFGRSRLAIPTIEFSGLNATKTQLVGDFYS